MTLGSIIVLGGWSYAVSTRMANDTTDLSIAKGRSVAWICTFVGILIDFTMMYLGV